MNNEIVSENVTNSSDDLASQGVHVKQTMTTPSRPGKKPRPVWVVSGNTFGLETVFRDIGGKKFRGAWSFFSDPAKEISDRLANSGRSTYAQEVEDRLERKEAKADRYESYAQNAELRANSASERANSIAAMIPMGQPILVGHHSEGRHRRDLKRIDSGMRKSIEESKKAEYFGWKAASLSNQASGARESRSYVGNRIEDATKELAHLGRQEIEIHDPAYGDQLRLRISNAVEKLEFWQARRKEIETKIIEQGGKVASPDSIKVGDEVYFHGWLPVVRVNRKTVTVSNWLGVPTLTYKLEYSKLKTYRTSAKS